MPNNYDFVIGDMYIGTKGTHFISTDIDEEFILVTKLCIHSNTVG